MIIGHKIVVLIIFVFIFFDLSTAQSEKLEYYKPIDIDSLLRSPITLSEKKTLAISNVRFVILYYGEIHKSGKAMHYVLTRDKPELRWGFSGTAALFKSCDSIFSMALSRKSQLEILKPFNKIKELKVKVKLIVYKAKKNDIRRGFLLQDIEIIKH